MFDPICTATPQYGPVRLIGICETVFVGQVDIAEGLRRAELMVELIVEDGMVTEEDIFCDSVETTKVASVTIQKSMSGYG